MIGTCPEKMTTMGLLMQPSKCAVVMELLGTGNIVRIWLDARHPDVVVPRRHKSDAKLVVEIGYNLPTPIRGMYVHPIRGFGGTLSWYDLGDSPCHVPWAAVWQVIADRTGAIWEDQVPQCVRAAEREREEERPTRPGFRRPNHLRLVESPPDDDPGPRAA
jgi:hypothetical protein